KAMLGWEDHQLPNHFTEWERRLHPDDRARALKTLRDYLDGRLRDYELEHRLLHRDGGYRWILARGVAVRDARGRPARIAGSPTACARARPGSSAGWSSWSAGARTAPRSRWSWRWASSACARAATSPASSATLPSAKGTRRSCAGPRRRRRRPAGPRASSWP